MHALLADITRNGWRWANCASALASEIPPNPIGDEWRSLNRKLVASSDGLRPPLDAGLLEVVTVRGSHTTATVNLMHYGCMEMFETCTVNGHVSKSKISEEQPSMSAPLDGMNYTVLNWQITVACPRLMEALSRTGNASHGVDRVATTLQGCTRIHTLFVSQGCDTSK